jgi:hypothetical protein
VSPMKKILLFFACLAAFSLPSFAQATLDLIGSNGTATVTTTAGSNFILNIDYTSTALTNALATFDITLSGSSTAGSAIPAGLTFDGFSNLVSGFTGNGSGVDADIFSAVADNSSDDISSTSPTTLLTATFTANATGSYTLFFAPNGNTTTDDQGLNDNSGTAISYISTGATVVVAPEPSTGSLLGLGLTALLGLGICRRAVTV